MPRPTPPKAEPKRPVEVVHPLWLLKALGLTIAGALVCGYITLCLLFYQGQWQLILHPSRTSQPLTAPTGVPGEAVRFDAAETGLPQLSGLWIPAGLITHYPNLTVLYLRGGDSSLAQSPADLHTLTVLHTLGLSVFAFDYRGYGQSAPIRPNQARMAEDAARALRYLTETRRIPEARIILYGSGLGASLATNLAAAHPGVPALILDSPGPSPIDIAHADSRVHALPVRLLFHEQFSLAPLATLKTPKLLISYPTPSTPIPPDFRTAADPKTTLELRPDRPDDLYPSLARFLDALPR